MGEIVQLLDPLDSTNTVLDDVLITLTGVFALVPGAGFLFDDVDAFTEKWTAFAQVRPFLGLLFSCSKLLFKVMSQDYLVLQTAR